MGGLLKTKQKKKLQLCTMCSRNDVKPLPPPSPTLAIPGSLDPLKSRTALFPFALAVFIIIIRLIIIVIIFHSAMEWRIYFLRARM